MVVWPFNEGIWAREGYYDTNQFIINDCKSNNMCVCVCVRDGEKEKDVMQKFRECILM